MRAKLANLMVVLTIMAVICYCFGLFTHTTYEVVSDVRATQHDYITVGPDSYPQEEYVEQPWWID